MSNNDIVHIVDMAGDTRTFAINGGITPRFVIEEFFGGDAEQLITQRTFKIVNRGPVRADNLDRNMEPGETITVYDNAVATGGVKGASN